MARVGVTWIARTHAPAAALILHRDFVLTADTNTAAADAVTRIGNLFLAADFVRTHTDLATMEGANEAARRAVNGILDATVERRLFAGLVPMFCPDWMARVTKRIEPLVERLPLVRNIGCAVYVFSATNQRRAGQDVRVAPSGPARR